MKIALPAGSDLILLKLNGPVHDLYWAHMSSHIDGLPELLSVGHFIVV